jgi:arylformamidase
MTGNTDPFLIRAVVPDFDAISAGFARDSDAARARLRHSPDLAYGEGPAARLDLYFPKGEGPWPVHMFLHGGYWRANRKEDYGFVAVPVAATGAAAAIVEYPLMPDARMATLVGHVRRAAEWLAEHGAALGLDPSRLTASGHSAGAHLATFLAARAPHEAAAPAVRPRALLLVSGIYDLAPITNSFLQKEIGLTDEEVARWTPLAAEPVPDVVRLLAVGGEETEPFHDQAADYARRAGQRARVRTVPGLDHMSIAAALRGDGGMGPLLAETLRAGA